MYQKGQYRARIKVYGVSEPSPESESKYDQVFIEFDLVGYYDAQGQLIDCAPGVRTYFKAITSNTISWIISDLKAIGYDRPGFLDFDPEREGGANLCGKEIDVVCDHETWKGKPRERWSIFQQRNRQKAQANKLAKLDDQYAEEFRKAFGNGKPASPPVTEPNTSDEIF